MFYARVWAVAGILTICTNLALTQTSGTVQGVVVDDQGQPINEATISINSLQAADNSETQTSTDGRFHYSGVIPGIYSITASKNELGGEVFRIRVRENRTVSVNFELTPGQRVAAYLGEAGQREALSRTFATGIEASRSGDYEISVESFLSALKLSPTCLECHFNLAIAYTELSRFTDAESEFREVLRLRPDYAAAYYGLSSIYNRLGRGAEASEARNEANRLALERVAVGRAQSEDAVARGLSFFNAGNISDAINRFEAAVDLDSSFATAYYWLGISLEESGRTGPARSAFQRYLQLASDGEFSTEARQRLENLGP